MSEAIGAPIIDDYLRGRIAAGDFPSAVYLIAERNEIRLRGAHGLAVRAPVQIPAALETIYDLASLTKPLVTGLLCALFVERNELALEDKVARYLPEYDRGEDSRLREITLRHLLTHTAGLAAWRSLRTLTKNDPGKTLAAVALTPLVAEPGAEVIYSDLGFITLGLLLEKLTALPLATLAAREIFTPLALSGAGFNPRPERRERIAAAETGNLYEREMHASIAGAGEDNDWRENLIWGEVHDGNAYFLGGVAGHAGLFAPAFDVWRLASQFVSSAAELLRPESCALFRRDLTPGLNEARSPGWQLAATPNSTAGPDLPADSFGHTGFTGTSCWIDAARERVFILLTNRTHDHALPFVNINGVRRHFHSLAVKALG